LSAADYANTVQKILFIFYFDGSAGTNPPAAIDNISIIGSHCNILTNVIASGITGYDATISFNTNGATDWEYVYGEAGTITDPDLETPVTSTDNPINLTGVLSPLTTYNFWIRSTCSNGTSQWIPLTFTTLAGCLAPLNIAASYITPDSIIVSWNANGSNITSYNIEYGPAGFTQGTGTVDATTDTFFVMEYLTPNTPYTIYVQSDCSGLTSPAWIQLNVSTIPEPVTLPYTQDFEDLTDIAEWNISNSSGNNGWFIGSATGNTGNSLYISNDNGTSNTYTNNNISRAVAKIYVDFGNHSEYNLSFDWKCYGESTYDLMQVFLLPANMTIPAFFGTTTSNSAPFFTGTDVIQLAGTSTNGIFNLNSSWTNATYTIPATVANTTKQLVFMWCNDGSIGSNPPAAIDNISITSADCAAPTALTASNIDMNSFDVSWTGSAAGYNIEYGPHGFTQGTGTTDYTSTNTYTLTGLTSATLYDIYVQADCGGDESTWVMLSQATTICNATDQCVYKFVAMDSYGDGWNGNFSVSVLQNGITVGTYSSPSHSIMNITTYDTFDVALCDGITTTLNFNPTTNPYPYYQEASFKLIAPDGTIVYNAVVGSIGTGSTLNATYTTNPYHDFHAGLFSNSCLRSTNCSCS